jgi:TonB-linked SusC/RagA family outer membrane protein
MEPNWEKVAMATKDDYRTTRVLGNSFLEIQFFKGLKFKTAADIDLQGITRNNFVNTVAAAGYNAPPPRPVTSITGLYSTNNYLSWLNENTLNYQTVFSNDHHVEALVGYSVQKYSEHFNSANGSNYSDQSIPYVSAAGTTTGSSGTTANSLISMIGRINYDYKGKYLLSGAIRQDGSSRFGEQRKYGVFPSVSAGWIVTDEAFLKDVSFVNFLKLRASYGTTGNNNIGDYPSNSLIGPTSYVFNNTKVGGKIVTQLGNGMLSWEKNNQFDIGVDVGLFNDRITFTYDYYNKITDGLLYQINIPQSSGFSSVNSNIGTFAFWGHEFSISSINLKGRLKWNTDFNISFERNRIEKLGTQNLPLLPANEYNQPWINAVGHPLSMFYGYINDGVYMNQHEFDTQPKHATSQVGTVRMKDVNEDGKITSDDRTFIGNPNPDFRVGFSNNLSYNNFDLSITFSGAIGGDIEDGLAESTENLDGAFNVYKRDIDHWRSEADPGNGIVPRTLVGTTALYRTISSNFVHDGSYLTCKNISLGYTFKAINKKYINRLRLYISVQQAFVITGYQGFNPETSDQGNSINGLKLGHDVTTYPVPRTFSFGINANL